MKKNEAIKDIISVAMLAGKIMLENGAETYRVEDTIKRICHSNNIEEAEVFVIPTGIFLSINFNDELYSYIKRISSINIDLHIISLVNDFSRSYVNQEITTKEAMDVLEEIANAPDFKLFTRCFFGGLSGGFFTIMFGGNVLELLLAFITSALVIFSVTEFNKYSQSFFLRNIIGGLVNTSVAITLTYFIRKLNLMPIDFNKIIIGSIMPLVPGVAFTNAIRDSINADFVSGVSKLLEATIIAIAIAIGVGFILQINLSFLGGF